MTDQTLELDNVPDDTPSPAPTGATAAKDDYHENLIEFIADAVITIDQSGIIETFNHAAEELFGYAKREVIGQNIKILMPPPYADEHDGYLADYLRTGETKIIGTWREAVGRQKNGTNIPIELGVREFKAGGHRRFAGIVRDSRALKRAQEEIERKNRDIHEISTPVISAWDKVLVLPLIGTLDSHRVQNCVEKALNRLAEDQAMVCIIDITGVPVIDTMVANHLISMAKAMNMMGCQCVLTGISPHTAMTIVGLGIDLSSLHTRGTLAEGLKLAIELVEREAPER